MAKNFSKFLLVFLIIFAWVFGGWPRIWQNPKVPPEIDRVLALNKVNNWNFNGNSTGWTATNGTGSTDGSGSPSCATSIQSTQTNFSTFAYNGNLSSQTAFGATSGATNGTWYAGKITQTSTAPGSGTVKVKGKMSYYANSGRWGNGKISLEIWDSTDTTFITSLVCITMSANASWTTTSFSSDVSLTGGTTYILKVSFVAKTRNSSAQAITLGVDNVVVNFAPTGLSASPSASSTSVSLSWATSTAGSGANGLNATTPYKIYSATSSPVSAFLTNGTTTSYLDTSTTGNTTYYYAVSDVDTASDESPLSAEASILTLPGTSTSPNFTNVQTSTLAFNWIAPAGGSPNYSVEMAPDVSGSPGSWSQRGTTSNVFYNDSGLSPSTTYWYRVRGYNATGYGQYSNQISTTTSAQAATISCSSNISSTNFSNIDNSSVYTSSPNASTTISCSGTSLGCTLYVKDTGGGGNPGLWNSSASRLIPSPASGYPSTATLSAGTEGYGIQAATTTAGSGGTLTIASRYLQTGNTVGGLSLTDLTLASSSVDISNREAIIIHKAAVSSNTLSGSYSDTITYSCVLN